MKLLTRSKFPPLYIFGLGLCNIFDGLCMILTLGFYTSQTSLPYVMKYYKTNIKNKQLNQSVYD